jgi:hypothetical protein
MDMEYFIIGMLIGMCFGLAGHFNQIQKRFDELQDKIDKHY